MLLGLKTKISITIVVLILTSMLLINLVVVFFWQQSLIQAEVRHIEAVVEHWYMGNRDLADEQVSASKSLMDLCITISGSCENIVLFDGNTEYSTDLESSSVVSALIRKSYTENRPINHITGLFCKFFIFGGKYLYHVFPQKNDAGARRVIAVTLDLTGLYENIATKQLVIFFYIAINTIILGTIGLLRLAKHVIRPIDSLICLSESYANNGEMLFPSLKQDNEFGKLSFALKCMLGRIDEDKNKLKENIKALETANKQLIESQKKMIHVEKMAAVGKLSAGLAHEVGNPIGIVQGYLELLENDDLTSEQRQQFSTRAIKELERINKMVRQLLDFARTSKKENAFVSVSQVCSEACGALQSQNISFEIEFETTFYSGDDIVGLGYDDLYQVIINCIFNAIDAISERGKICEGKVNISSRLSEAKFPKQRIEILITDNGIGIAEDQLTAVFDPFFTTKEIGKGTGLGLSISYGIIDAAGGVMEIESIYGKGTNVIISLPLVCGIDNSITVNHQNTKK